MRMTSIQLKENLFSEKIGAVRIAHKGSDSLLHTLYNIDFLPTTISLYAEIDFFNIKSNTDYILLVSLYHENLESNPVHATKVNMPQEQLLFSKNNVGKAQGNIAFDIVVQNPEDVLLLFTFLSPNGIELDSYYQYLSISLG